MPLAFSAFKTIPTCLSFLFLDHLTPMASHQTFVGTDAPRHDAHAAESKSSESSAHEVLDFDSMEVNYQTGDAQNHDAAVSHGNPRHRGQYLDIWYQNTLGHGRLEQNAVETDPHL